MGLMWRVGWIGWRSGRGKEADAAVRTRLGSGAQARFIQPGTTTRIELVCELYTLCDVYREVLPWRVELDGTSCAVSLV